MSDSSLTEASARIDESLANLFEQLKEEVERYDKALIRYNEEFRVAQADGDLRENASFEEALKNIQTTTADRASSSMQLDGIRSVRGIMNSYIPTNGRVQMLSTVKIRRVRKTNSPNEIDSIINDEYIFRIFPYGISDFRNGILSSDSVVGYLVMDKAIGDVIKIRSRSSSKYAHYEIVDIK